MINNYEDDVEINFSTITSEKNPLKFSFPSFSDSFYHLLIQKQIEDKTMHVSLG